MGMVYTDAIGYPVTFLFPSLMPTTSSLVLVASYNGPLHLFDRTTGTSLQKYTADDLENGEYRLRAGLAFADRYVISGSENGKIFVWDTLQGNLVKTFSDVHGGKVVSAIALRLGMSGRRAEGGNWASAGGDGTVIVWGQ
jgi:mitogen-activated protein kinase organizer 1